MAKSREALVKQLAKKPGIRAKVDAMCVQCIYEPMVPRSWRKQVRECRVITCPLHPVRARQLVGEVFNEDNQ